MAQYILVIHGTFSAPEAGKTKWFQLSREDSQNFCYRLNQALAAGPLNDAEWRKFEWSGGNTHAAREDGAKKLCDLLLDIRRSDPEARIHLIAHSHGGNVVLKAIELYFERLDKQAREIVERIKTEIKQGRAYADVIDETLREVCGDALAKSKEFHCVADEFILPNLREGYNFWNRRRSVLFMSWLVYFLFRNEFILSPFRSFFAAWRRSPQSHRLGRLVFMGTPFYYKRWLAGSRARRGVSYFIDFLLNFILSGVIFGVYLLRADLGFGRCSIVVARI